MHKLLCERLYIIYQQMCIIKKIIYSIIRHWAPNFDKRMSRVKQNLKYIV